MGWPRCDTNSASNPIGAALAIAGLFTAKVGFVDSVLGDLYQANILARITAGAPVTRTVTVRVDNPLAADVTQIVNSGVYDYVGIDPTPTDDRGGRR